VVAGFAGAAPPELDPGDNGFRRARAALRRACERVGIGPDIVDVRSDAEIAYAAGAGAGPDGLVLICGSGAVGARISGGAMVATVDGHGRFIDDAGSGLWIGRHAMRAALRDLDGRGQPTALTAAVARRLGVTAAGPRPLATAAQARDEFYLATLSPLVTAAAADGDAVANAILDRAADELASTVTALAPVPGEPLVTTGALLAPGGPLVPRLTSAVHPLGLVPSPVADGLTGAVTLARAAVASTAGCLFHSNRRTVNRHFSLESQGVSCPRTATRSRPSTRCDRSSSSTPPR
jgi:glucosamine kinase